MKRKVLASLLCVAMGVTMIGSTAVFAEDAAEETTDEAATEENARRLRMLMQKKLQMIQQRQQVMFLQNRIWKALM